jgi:MerR family transcriptional regulator, light-induced transcriptional regulator
MRSEQTFTIGDVSQQTGIASVTLRAWERRYGLIKPQRTPKGHRVYNQDNIQQIQHILSWLNRGVAIRKVAALLASGKSSNATVSTDEQWLKQQDGLLAAITQLKQRGLDQLLDQLNKATPFVTLCEQVYQPLQALLIQRWQQQPLGYQLEQQLWQQGWQRQTLIATLRADKQKAQGNCYLANLDIGRPSLDYYLLHILLLQSGIRVNAFNTVDDLAGLTRLNNIAELPLMIFADQRVEQPTFNQLSKLSNLWQEDIICVGRMADIHDKQLADIPLNSVGGNMSECWHSAVMQAWLAKLKK